MEKIDIKTLQTVKNYSFDVRLTTAAIYKKIKAGKLKGIEIDGVKFVVLEEKESEKTYKQELDDLNELNGLGGN